MFTSNYSRLSCFHLNWPSVLCTVVLALGLSTSANASTLFKCTQPNGTETFSDQPCSTEFTQLKLQAGMVTEKMHHGHAPAKFSRQASSRRDMVGHWERQGFTYTLLGDGSLRAEKVVDGKIVAWRSGTWLLQSNRLSMSFNHYSSTTFKQQSSNEHFMAGVIHWSKDRSTFSIRYDGALKHFKRIDDQIAAR